MPKAQRKRFVRKSEKPIEFEINGEVYRATPVLPNAGTELVVELMQLEDAVTQIDRDNATPEEIETATRYVGAIGDFFGMVLLKESAELFIKRSADPDNPITFEQSGEVLAWLMEFYGDRPTKPSGSSANGSGGTGTSSTGTAPTEESTLGTSGSIDYSTSPTS